MKKLKNIYSVYLLLYFVLYFPLLMQFFTNTKKFLIVYFFTSSILILLYLFINWFKDENNVSYNNTTYDFNFQLELNRILFARNVLPTKGLSA